MPVSFRFLTFAIMFVAVGCGRGSTPGPRPQVTPAADGASTETPAAEPPSAADADMADAAPDAAPDATSGDAGSAETRWSGITGRIKTLAGSAEGGEVVIAVPDSDAPVKRAKVGAKGVFEVRGLEPGTYRLIVPADGVHATAEMYVSVVPDAGPAKVVVPRSKGCPVKITVRDHDNETIAGATLELALTDLPQVPERHRSRGVTDKRGRIVLTGSCVRGYFEGQLRVPGRGDFDVRHGYVGTGYDQFDIVLPESPDAGVGYANDD